MSKIFVEMRQLFEAGDIRPAMALQARANEVISMLFGFGILAAIKAMMGMRGVEVGPPREPHTPLDDSRIADLQKALDGLSYAVE